MQINILETIRKKIVQNAKAESWGRPFKDQHASFFTQACPVPKDIFISHSILTGKVASTETFVMGFGLRRRVVVMMSSACVRC